MSTLQPITLYGAVGANPPKVQIILEELSIPYTIIPTTFAEVKGAAFLAINPNGRMPAIHDPNTSLTLWESGAIVEYLVETYDGAGKLGFARGSAEAFLAKQWLFFQVSGQGPYYGQAAWFTKFHPEKVESAVARYVAEMKRVTGVVEGHLKRQGTGEKGDGPWLVGGRYSYADASWVMWQVVVEKVMGREQYDLSEWPVFKGWIERILQRESVKKVVENLPVPGAKKE